MDHLTCSCKARRSIRSSVRQKLLRHSNFACSICGKIPIVYHHIEKWSKKFSNDEKYIIPICSECHADIHGSGRSIYTKKELYNYKISPVKPKFLKKKYKLKRKQDYSFFIGSNFVASGKRATLFQFSGNPLAIVDTSSGNLQLSILSSLENGKVKYLIRDNELVIDTKNIWRMKFSGPKLKIWKQTGNKKIIFIDLWIKPNVIVIKEMNTEFNGKLFRVYKLRTPQERQLKKIDSLVKECEKYYHKASTQIDKQPQIAIPFRGFDVDKQIKDLQKDRLKHELERKPMDALSQNFKWDWNYCWHVLDRMLEKSPVFRKEKKTTFNSSEQLIEISKKIERLKGKYKQEFDELQDIVIQYDGIILSENIAL